MEILGLLIADWISLAWTEVSVIINQHMPKYMRFPQTNLLLRLYAALQVNPNSSSPP